MRRCYYPKIQSERVPAMSQQKRQIQITSLGIGQVLFGVGLLVVWQIISIITALVLTYLSSSHQTDFYQTLNVELIRKLLIYWIIGSGICGLTFGLLIISIWYFYHQLLRGWSKTPIGAPPQNPVEPPDEEYFP